MIIETNILCGVFSIHSIKVNKVIRLKRDSFLQLFLVKFIYSEKATKFFEIFTLLLSYVVPAKGKVKISQNFVAFSEYMNSTGVHGRLSYLSEFSQRLNL